MLDGVEQRHDLNGRGDAPQQEVLELGPRLEGARALQQHPGQAA